MPDRDLTDEEYDFINTALDILAQSDPEGPTAEEDRVYCSLLDMGCTEQWIAEQITMGASSSSCSHVFA
jgi:hypothetical protein